MEYHNGIKSYTCVISPGIALYLPDPVVEHPEITSIISIGRIIFKTGFFMKFKLLYPLITIILILSGCNPAKLTLIPRNGTILAFGDSLTIGKGVDISDSYPSVLAELSGRIVINEGIIGEETSEGLQRLETILKEVKPDIVILLEGGNDILQDKDLSLTKANLSKMIELIQNNNSSVVLVGVPDKTLATNSAIIYKELTEKYNLVLEESIIMNLLVNPEYKYDDHHFNKKGYRLLAESIYEILHDNGAL